MNKLGRSGLFFSIIAILILIAVGMYIETDTPTGMIIGSDNFHTQQSCIDLGNSSTFGSAIVVVGDDYFINTNTALCDKVYTFSGAETLVINSSGITLDCGNADIKGNISIDNTAILLNSSFSGVIIQNCNITKFTRCLDITESDGNHLTNNIFSDCTSAIEDAVMGSGSNIFTFSNAYGSISWNITNADTDSNVGLNNNIMLASKFVAVNSSAIPSFNSPADIILNGVTDCNNYKLIQSPSFYTTLSSLQSSTPNLAANSYLGASADCYDSLSTTHCSIKSCGSTKLTFNTTQFSSYGVTSLDSCITLTDNRTFGSMVVQDGENYYINNNIVICNSTFSRLDINLDGVFIINKSSTSFDCNGSTFSGDGQGTWLTSKYSGTTVKNCNAAGYSNGIIANGSTFTITNNKLSDITNLGISLNKSTGSAISGNTLQNSNIALNLENANYSTTTISNNKFTSNSISLQLTNASSLSITGQNISANDKSIIIKNNSAGITLTDTIFDRDKIIIGESDADTSKLTVKWNINVTVNNKDSDPIDAATVVCKNNANTILFNRTTNIMGQITTQLITDFVKNYSSTTDYNKHVFNISKSGKTSNTLQNITSTTNIIFELPLTPPEIKLLSPKNNSKTSLTTQTFSWEGTDSDNDVLNFTLKVDSVTYNTNDEAHQVTGLAIGNHTWYVTATDRIFTNTSETRYFETIKAAVDNSFEQYQSTNQYNQTTQQNQAGNFQTNTVTISTAPSQQYITPQMGLKFAFGGADHTIRLSNIAGDQITLIVQSTPKTITLTKNSTRQIDITDDGVPDLSITYKGVVLTRAELELSTIERKVEAPPATTPPKEAAQPPAPPVLEKPSNETNQTIVVKKVEKITISWPLIIGLVLMLGFMSYMTYDQLKPKKKKHQIEEKKEAKPEAKTPEKTISKTDALKKVTQDEYNEMYEYAKKTLTAGYNKDRVKKKLAEGDWPTEAIDQILDSFK